MYHSGTILLNQDAQVHYTVHNVPSASGVFEEPVLNLRVGTSPGAFNVSLLSGQGLAELYLRRVHGSFSRIRDPRSRGGPLDGHKWAALLTSTNASTEALVGADTARHAAPRSSTSWVAACERIMNHVRCCSLHGPLSQPVGPLSQPL